MLNGCVIHHRLSMVILILKLHLMQVMYIQQQWRSYTRAY